VGEACAVRNIEVPLGEEFVGVFIARFIVVGGQGVL
jgi:hypothetical protein